MKIKENKVEKRLISDTCNYYFRKDNGLMMTWGKTMEEDPEYSPYGPFILDIEISTICSGNCKFCYKTNTEIGKNMSFETFKAIFHKMPRTLTQIAFGIGSIDSNPDLWKIMKYCRNNDYNEVIPNITINGQRLTDEYANKLVKLCGAVAVSRYNSDTCYNAVKKLADLGLKQVNIHQLLCNETLDSCYKVINDWKIDKRLKDLNAIVFLLMKPKGKRNRFHQLTSLKEYKKLIDYAFECNAPIGFYSCSALSFIRAVKNRENFKQLEMLAEPCESNCFSSYINVEGRLFHCSFTEGEDGWKGIDIINCNNFMDVWNSPEVVKFRKLLMENHKKYGCRSCPIFDLNMEE